MNEKIKEFINECFIKDIIFGENSVYNTCYDEDSANNHNTLPNNNSNDVYISNDANYVESAISHDEIRIHPNSNSYNMAYANITAIKEDSEINNISKVTVLNKLIKELNCFLKEYRILIAKLRKESKNQIS